MKNLLDTHVVLWFLNGENLSDETLTVIQENENYISVVSLWEVAIKMNLSKLSFDGGFQTFCELIKLNGFEVIPIKDEYMQKLFDLPFVHRDLFDRMIIATAIIEDMTVISADNDIKCYTDVKHIW